MAEQFRNFILALAAALLAGGALAEEQHDRHMHHRLPRDVEAFHAALGPLWHAPAGKERSRKACAKAGELESLAKDIRSGDATPLLASIEALKKKCQAGQPDIDAAFSDVHEAFHRLAEPGRAG